MNYKINDFLISPDINSASKNNEKFELTSQEVIALKLFFSSDDGFVDTQTLESEIWGERIVTKNSLRKLISDLRLKFGDRESFKNIRGRGYKLNFESFEPSKVTQKKVNDYKYLFTLLFIILICIVAILSYSYKDKIETLPKVSTQTVFESKDYILDYATYNNSLFVTARDKNTSKLYKVLNRQKTVLMSENYSGAYRGLEIHTSGRTIMHVVEDSKCKIKIFQRPVEDQIDEIPCNRQNAFPSFDWIDDNRFYITFNVDPSSSIKPFIYDLSTKRLEEVSSINFKSENNKNFIDAYIKGHNDGVFSLRENHLDEMSLTYFEGSNRKTFYKFRAKPYSVAVAEHNLFFVGNNNELFMLPLSDDILSQDINLSLLMASQAAKIDDPLILEKQLYLTLGNIAKEVIYSSSGNFTYSLENGVRDFTYTDKVLTILALTNSGYAIEQLKDGLVFNSIYFDSNLSFRHVAFYQGDIFLAGSDGIYKLVENKLTRVSNIKTTELVSNGKCMIAEGEGIHLLDQKTHTFIKIVEQGERAFQSEQGCFFVDTLTGNIVNENREIISKQTKRRLLIEHKGKIAHRYNVKEQTHIVDINTGKVIEKTKSRARFTKLISYEDDILYLGEADVNTSILRLKLD
ncbi:winged helix-turn-helix domain-containing protein [Pseudoalteromonas sp. A3]|uniref:winged helix-turn-helix domain-containing protein n=1 Tax=Pseudoalteromonas sp. A3 TaxID=142792 RepID=UPI00221F41E0|nr:winged helix-turn-helix domain-containing protein [Pseudoalteromonas sp. A3]MCW1720212.1 winged helix-turn-helix domain-containing protein [Pseudoalteromonas sp. A3]